MTAILCSKCGTKLGECVDGVIVIMLNVRGGETRRIIAHQCIIVCEKCGWFWMPEPEHTPATLKVAS